MAMSANSWLMPTAIVKVQGHRGNLITARALLDSCSTVNLITDKFANLLQLPRSTCSINIGAVDGLSTVAKQFITLTCFSKLNKTRFQLKFLVVPNIADVVPCDIFPRHLFDLPSNITLADPQFHLPKPVDILLDSSTTFSTLSIGQIRLQHSTSAIILQKTLLGWVVTGGGTNTSSSPLEACNLTTLDRSIERFWTIEDLDSEPVKSRDEVACERHYVTHTKRDPSGRYVVRLPFRDTKFDLGESRKQTLQRFESLEKKFKSNPTFKAEYHKVMNDYIAQGYMSLCETECDKEGSYYLPHHAVLKDSSETTKFRVVFDASAKTSTGISLNDTLMVGPTIQDTLFDQVIRFRTRRYVLTGDIKQMYLQILVHPADRKFQRIFWYHHGKIRVFQLNTVTFGTAAAPFLAIRTLKQLALDEAHDFPNITPLILRDFYVDDFITGASSGKELVSIRDGVSKLLLRGGFVIRKWASNHPESPILLNSETLDLDYMVRKKTLQNTLGIVWDTKNDLLQYTVVPVNPQTSATKRKLVSEVSKIFDPLGLLGPVILKAKDLIQGCWKAKITWDESLPQDLHTIWQSLASQLPLLQKVTFPRSVVPSDPVRIEIHGFCDASRRGYGACLFARSINSQGTITVRLICAKSRVAPLSGVTIPRLELCAASVLKKLYLKVKPHFDVPVSQVTFWSDSTIVLCWLKKPPHVLRTFESNRVADIQTLGDQVQWRHVCSEDNAADPLSRGQLPSEFLLGELWKLGPSWLSKDEAEWPRSIESSLTKTSGEKGGLCLVTTVTCAFQDIYLRFSSYERFLRIVAYMLRLKRKAHILRLKKKAVLETETSSLHPIDSSIPPTRKSSKVLLSPFEIMEAERHVLILVQKEELTVEYQQIANTSKTSKRSTSFDRLCPFIDDHGLMRVGGRLTNANIPDDQKHPILLPQTHHITQMIIRHYHNRGLHSGVQTTHYALRSKFFILNGKSQVWKIIRQCIECIRQKPPVGHAQMANLPKPRVNETYPFYHTGVDFFGPVSIKERAEKNRTMLKAYGCVFVCLASKAVHIELAKNLSTEGFLEAFRRFIGRRGLPAHVYSDNGTNFVGANNELEEIYNLFDTDKFQGAIRDYTISKRLQWHFNPPLSPHFGGIWEAAVKSFKHHLKRIVDRQLTYEQFNTLLIEIEAILNSRPLGVLSADPNDPLVISPAHLLIGRPFNFLPSNSFLSVPDNRLSVYKFLLKARQTFWDCWHKEYLRELQVRQKWDKSTVELKVGSVVLLIEDNISNGQWPMGVIMDLHPGSDNITRVATVKTASGTYKRNITRLCVLPVL